MKCAWIPCSKEAVVDDGFCCDSHQRNWLRPFIDHVDDRAGVWLRIAAGEGGATA